MIEDKIDIYDKFFNNDNELIAMRQTYSKVIYKYLMKIRFIINILIIFISIFKKSQGFL